MTTLWTAITTIWAAISSWVVDAVEDLTEMFYTSSGGLTFLGTLSVIGLGISIVFLLIGFIQNFLHLRG